MHTEQTSSTNAAARPAATPEAPAAQAAPPTGASAAPVIQPPEGAIFQRLDLTPGFPYTLRYYIRRFAWQFVQSTLIRYSPRRANGWRRFWLCKFGAKMHPTAITKASTKIILPWDFSMGKHSCLAENVETWGAGTVSIGDHTIVSRDAFLCVGGHDYTKANLPIVIGSLKIGSGVWVGAKAWISGDVTIGDNSIVGACAVVTKSVAPGMIVAGNPAKPIKPRRMEWDPALMNAPERG